MEFAKMHEAHNDFLVLLDMPARLEMMPSAVAALCDRHGGLGAAGMLRLTVAGSAREAGIFDALPEGVTEDDWFLDVYDASGRREPTPRDGFRAAAHFLHATGLERRDRLVIGCLAGRCWTTVHAADTFSADISVDHLVPTLVCSGPVRIGGRDFDGWMVDVGKRHLACVEAGPTAGGLAELDLETDVHSDLIGSCGADMTVLTAPPNGHVCVRTRRYGFGEVGSDSGGAISAAMAVLRRRGSSSGEVTVRYADDQLVVVATASGYRIRGPSILLARGDVDRDWWRNEGKM